METSLKNTNDLLRQTSALSAHYKELSRLSGEDFNIFRVINFTTKEVAVHSAFIAELLNPRGSHGQGPIFLELFVKQLGITFPDCSNAKVVAEESIGAVTETTGGQIDIMISDGVCCIVIENKIYADDQQNQLIRYHNHCKQYKSHKLLYLTLDGRKASGESTEDILKEETEQKNAESTYKSISYRDDIILWLEACRKEAAALPVLREGITHYINLIKFLTNQSTNKAMENEIVKILTTTPEHLETADKIVTYIDNAKAKIQLNFWGKLFEALENEQLVVSKESNPIHKKKSLIGFRIEIYNENGISIQWGAEIHDRFYTGFLAVKSKEDDDIVKYKKLISQLNEKYDESDPRWLGWKYSTPKFNFANFNETPEIYRLADEKELKEIVKDIVNEAKREILSFKELLNKS